MNRKTLVGAVCLLAVMLMGVAVMAAPIPAEMTRPDNKPADMKKPVKAYILAGQSNMVGMGDIGGARPLYPSIFLSADPAIIPGVMPIGGSALAAHGVYQSADANAVKGAEVSVYKGAYDPKADYATLTPVKTATLDLGTVSKNLPAVDGPHTVVVSAAIDVPATGNYTVHAGFEDSLCNVVTLDGKEVYRKDIGGQPVIAKVALAAGKRYPVTITYFKGGSAAFWLQQVDLEGKGDLVTVTKKDNKFTYLQDEAGKWSVRNDVVYTDPRLFPDRASSPLSATSNNGKSIGPEVGFGYVMGTFHDEQVLLIKTAMGNRSLGFDFRPPSSGRTDVSNQYESLEYTLMVKGVRETLAKIDKVVPGYQGQGYEIVGFGWFQGHKDSGSTKEEYEKHLVNLINDLRKEFKAPKMPAVVATVGFHGYRIVEGPWKGVWEAQMAVGDPKQHPEFAGTVASVDTRDFWREVEESPVSQDYHYNRNAETYLLVGEAMGRAMVGLLGGKAEPIPLSDRKQKAVAMAGAQKADPTEPEKAASLAALKPMILNGVLADFMANPANRTAVEAAAKFEKPAAVPQFLRDPLDSLVAIYVAAGMHEYDWKPFGPDLNNSAWSYFSFDPPETLDKTKGVARYRKVTCPAGMENWFAPDFDAVKAGWKQGQPPFGQLGGKLAPLSDSCKQPWCLCSVTPRTLWEKEVLLIRGTFDIPPFKDGYRYRFVLGGSDHVMSGEGYAIYANGKLLAESKSGVPNRAGGQPRGGHVYADLRGEFKGGKVTLAATSFLQFNKGGAETPPRGHLTLWLEEQKLPPVGE